MAKVKCGLIQMAFKGDTSKHPDEIRDVMLEAHIPYIEEAGKQELEGNEIDVDFDTSIDGDEYTPKFSWKLSIYTSNTVHTQ